MRILLLLSLFVSIFQFSTTADSAPRATSKSGSPNGLIRFDIGIGLTGDLLTSDETLSSVFYQHGSTASGFEALVRLGLRSGSFSLGGVGYYGYSDVESTRTSSTTPSKLSTKDSYRFSVTQGISGGFVAYNFGGKISDFSNFELLGEYYSSASRSIFKVDDSTVNPYKPKDKMNGKGWGVGISAKNAAHGTTTTLMFRSISYDNANLDGVDYELPTSSKSKIQQNGVVLSGSKVF